MKNYKRCTVVMLPTNQKANVGEFGIFSVEELPNYGIQCGVKPQECYNCTEINYHLYFLSDDEIQEGDIVYCNSLKQIIKVGCSSVDDKYPSWFKKVIASTDTTLNLPQPSKAFVEKYCEKGGIDKVMVEFVEHDHPFLGVVDYTPKVSDNTITIKPVNPDCIINQIIP